MSYLAKVIATANEAESIDLKTKIGAIDRRVSTLNGEVKNYLENKYVKFLPMLRENHLITKTNELLIDIENLKLRTKKKVKSEVEEAIHEVEILTEQLENTNYSLALVKNLLDIDATVNLAEKEQSEGKLWEAAKKLKTVDEELKSEENRLALNNLLLCQAFNYRIADVRDRNLAEALMMWRQFVRWEERDTSEGRTVRMTIDSAHADAVPLLAHYDLDYEAKKLADRLLRSVFQPVIQGASNVSIRTPSDEHTVSHMEVARLKSGSWDALSVIQQLERVCQFLAERLDAYVDAERTFIEQLADCVEAELCTVFVRDCLSHAVPVSKSQIAEFVRVVERVVEFDAMLKETGFLKPMNTVILDYVKNIDNLMVTKRSQFYLVEARKIFEKDLHDMMHVGKQSKSVADAPNKDNCDDSDLELCKNTFQFPSCNISKSTEEVIRLIKRILIEIISCSGEVNDVQLFYTARNIVGLYCDLMPLKHKELLRSIPQQAALFYNNCMYLGHELTLLGVEYCSILKDNIATFVDFVDPLRSIGETTLASQIEIQRVQLSEILKYSGLNNVVEHSDFLMTAEKSLRQCLRQLELLRSVWQTVLPVNIYCKSIGTLCNYFLEKLVEFVLKMEDITLDVDSQLTHLFTIIVDKLPQLFQDSKEVVRHVKKWTRFGELLQVLSGGLKDIEERWANGKGPLALEFSADQLKRLVRALFQNSDRRAALLARIR